MSSSADKLVQIFDALPDTERKTLLDFAEFLRARSPSREPVATEPLDIPRPDNESVVAAIKRLNRTYPMVERSSVFNETSDLMMQHMMQGRAAMDIIDELEELFEQKFRALFEERQ
jgi:hypothetical protein